MVSKICWARLLPAEGSPPTPSLPAADAAPAHNTLAASNAAMAPRRCILLKEQFIVYLLNVKSMLSRVSLRHVYVRTPCFRLAQGSELRSHFRSEELKPPSPSFSGA